MSFFAIPTRLTFGGRLRRFALASGLVVASALSLVPSELAEGCGGTPPTPRCSKAYVFAKAGPLTFVGAGIPFTFPITTGHFLSLVEIPAGSGVCPPGPHFVTMTATIGPCVPGPAAPPVVVGPFPIGPGFSVFPVTIPVPAGPARICLVSITSTVTFSDGTSLSRTADQQICIVDPSPGNPAEPRLDMELLTPDATFHHPGGQNTSTYRLTNNDPTESWTGTITVDMRNVAGDTSEDVGSGNPGDGVYAISDTGPGDNFPIAFLEDLAPPFCIPLPPAPQDEILSEIQKPITLLPGEVRDIDVVVRSWGMCANGSCGESTAVADGLYSDGTDGFACAGTLNFVDTGAPPQFEWQDAGSAGLVQPLPFPPFGLDLFGQPSPDQLFGWVNVIPQSSFQVDSDLGPVPVIPQIDPIPLDPNYGRLQSQLQLLKPQPFNVDSFFDIAFRIQFQPSPTGEPLIQPELLSMDLVGGAPAGFEHIAPMAMGALQLTPQDPTSPPSIGDIFYQVSGRAILESGNVLPLEIPGAFFNPGSLPFEAVDPGSRRSCPATTGSTACWPSNSITTSAASSAPTPSARCPARATPTAAA